MHLELVEKARINLKQNLHDVMSVKSTYSDSYPFIETSASLTFMLQTLFEFECDESNVFLNLDFTTEQFVDQSSERTLFKLDFTNALFTIRKFEWKLYSTWTMLAIKDHLSVGSIFCHLTNILKAMPCRFRFYAKWRKMGKFFNR